MRYNIMLIYSHDILVYLRLCMKSFANLFDRSAYENVSIAFRLYYIQMLLVRLRNIFKIF